MSKSLVIGTALCFIGVAAHAGGSEYGHDKPAPTPTYTATVNNAAAARASSVAAAAAQSRSISNATGGNATGGQSRSNANATGGNATGGNATGGRSNATGGRGGNVTVSNSTGRSNTPDVIAPSINGGNPCTVGASTGVSLPGFGLMGGGSWEGTDCTRRQAAAMFATMGRSDVAFEILCQNMDVRYAMANAGTPCQVDRQRWTAAGWKQR